MSDKARILAAIRRAALPPADAPPAPPVADRPADPETLVAGFSEALAAVAGVCIDVAGPDALAAAVKAQIPDGATWYSRVAAIPGALNPPDGAGPHAYADVDLAVVPGVFGVAENGAVWVSSADVPQPAVLFLAQRLAVVLPRHALVPDMHAAYARLAVAGPLPDYGVFIAGPSKTADIEQCLVIGAHGPRALTVFLHPPPGIA